MMTKIQESLPPDRLRPLPPNLDAVIQQLTGK